MTLEEYIESESKRADKAKKQLPNYYNLSNNDKLNIRSIFTKKYIDLEIIRARKIEEIRKSKFNIEELYVLLEDQGIDSTFLDGKPTTQQIKDYLSTYLDDEYLSELL